MFLARNITVLRVPSLTLLAISSLNTFLAKGSPISVNFFNRENAKLLVKSIHAMGKEIGKLSEIVKTKHLQVGSLDEEAILTHAKSFLSSEFNAKISIFQETDAHRYDPQERAKFANPYRPAIFIK